MSRASRADTMAGGGKPVTGSALTWSVGSDARGSTLETAVDAMNAHGPFSVDDGVTRDAPRWVQLVEGTFRVMTPASFFHGCIANEVAGLLRTLLPSSARAYVDMAVRISDETLREADVCVYLNLALAEAQDGPTFSRLVPDLVVEILSPSTSSEDRGPKRDDYAQVGVREYYLLDPHAGAVEAFCLEEGRYATLEPEGDRFPSHVLQSSWTPADVLP